MSPAAETLLIFSEPKKTRALDWFNETLLTPGHKLTIETIADPFFDESSREVALTVTVFGVGAVSGAV